MADHRWHLAWKIHSCVTKMQRLLTDQQIRQLKSLHRLFLRYRP
jgi:hypothetical protein